MVTFGKPKRISTRKGTLSEIYYVRVNENGRRTWRTTGKTKLAEAKEVRDSWIRTGEYEQKIARKHLIQDVVEEYLDSKKLRVATTTFQLTLAYIRKFASEIGPRAISEIGAKEVDHFLQGIAATGVLPITVNNHRSILATFFNYCIKRGYVSRNPATMVDRLKVVHKPPIALSDEEEERVIEAAQKVDKTFGIRVLTAIYTGLRKGTLDQLQWYNVNFGNCVWDIEAKKMKSRRPFQNRPIHNRVLTTLKALKEETNPALTDLVFGLFDEYQWRNTRAIANVKIKYHALRASFASHCYRHGVPIEMCAWLGDWSSLTVLQRHYLSHDTGHVRNILGKAFSVQESELTK